jgi:hypothetical protein
MTHFTADTLARLATVPLMLFLMGNEHCQDPEEDNTPPETSDEVLGDYGDAPDGYPTRYTPGDGVATMGSFPSDAHVTHIDLARLGSGITAERGVLDPEDGDGTHNMTDDDRRDDGIVALRALTATSITADVSITAAPDAPAEGWFLNVLLDANGDGEWAETDSYPEWRVENMPITVVPGGEIVVELTGFWPVPSHRQAWMRLALTNSAVDGSDWDGSGAFEAGEIEDYLVLRPVLDVAFDYDYDYDYDSRSREEEIAKVVLSIDSMRETSLVYVASLAAVEVSVETSVVDASLAAVQSSASAAAAAAALAAAESHAVAAQSSASSASASASSTASSSASVPCGTASARASSSATASASAAADATFAAGAAASNATSTSTSTSFGADVAAIAAGAADAAASTDVLALALASGDCEGEICELRITTTSELETELTTCDTSSSLLAGDVEECTAEVGILEGEIDGIVAELDVLVDEVDLLADDLQVCQTDLESGGGPIAGPSTALTSMTVGGAGPIGWSLPTSPVHLTVSDEDLTDLGFGSPGCCSVYDVTLECAE